MGAEDPSKGGLSLVEYARKKRAADCPVCQLPEGIRQQMRMASDKKIKRTVVLEWLTQEQGLAITDSDLTVHYSGKHDQ